MLEPALLKNSLAFNNWKIIVDAVNEQTHFTDADFAFPGTVFGSWIPRNSNAHLAIHSAILASELKAEGAVAVCAVLNDEKDHRTDKYEQEWNGFWRFHNLMQFSEEFIAVSSTGMSRMDYLALPVSVNAVSDPVVSVTEIDDAWDAIIELMYDDDIGEYFEDLSPEFTPELEKEMHKQIAKANPNVDKFDCPYIKRRKINVIKVLGVDDTISPCENFSFPLWTITPSLLPLLQKILKFSQAPRLL